MSLKYWPKGQAEPTSIQKFKKDGKDLKHPVSGHQVGARHFSNMTKKEREALDVYDVIEVKPSIDDKIEYHGDPKYNEVTHTLDYAVIPLSPAVISRKKAEKIKAEIKIVKQYANDDILKTMKEWKQRNMITVGILIVSKVVFALIKLLVVNKIITDEQLKSDPVFDAYFGTSAEANKLLKAWKGTVVPRRKLSDQQEKDLKNETKTLAEISEELYPENER